MPPKKKGSSLHENPMMLWCTWLAAAICTIIVLAIIIAGIVVFIGYLVIHPRVPIISVVNGHLNQFQYDLAGILITQVNIVLRSENDNMKAHAIFSDLKLTLFFEGMKIAIMVAEQYEVKKNSSVDFNYEATSAPISLGPQQMQDVDVFLNQDRVRFDLKGSTRAQWRVGPFPSVKFWCHLNCELQFHRSDGNYIPSRCTSKSK